MTTTLSLIQSANYALCAACNLSMLEFAVSNLAQSHVACKKPHPILYATFSSVDTGGASLLTHFYFHFSVCHPLTGSNLNGPSPYCRPVWEGGRGRQRGEQQAQAAKPVPHLHGRHVRLERQQVRTRKLICFLLALASIMISSNSVPVNACTP